MSPFGSGDRRGWRLMATGLVLGCFGGAGDDLGHLLGQWLLPQPAAATSSTSAPAERTCTSPDSRCTPAQSVPRGIQHRGPPRATPHRCPHQPPALRGRPHRLLRQHDAALQPDTARATKDPRRARSRGGLAGPPATAPPRVRTPLDGTRLQPRTMAGLATRPRTTRPQPARPTDQGRRQLAALGVRRHARVAAAAPQWTNLASVARPPPRHIRHAVR